MSRSMWPSSKRPANVLSGLEGALGSQCSHAVRLLNRNASCLESPYWPYWTLMTDAHLSLAHLLQALCRSSVSRRATLRLMYLSAFSNAATQASLIACIQACKPQTEQHCCLGPPKTDMCRQA